MWNTMDNTNSLQEWSKHRKLFSTWRPSTILNLGKLQFWSRDLYWHVILHLLSEFRVDWPIRRRNIAKKRFSIWRPSAILNLKNFDFCQIAILGMEICIGIPNLLEIGQFRLRYGDKAIFKMAVVRHLEFAKIAVLVKWPISACDSSSPFRNLHKSANMALRYCQKRF